jgi:hypothetical protein
MILALNAFSAGMNLAWAVDALADGSMNWGIFASFFVLSLSVTTALLLEKP